jgi:integrase-like protein
VKHALKRANIDAPAKGAHLLRHTAATEMLRNGVPLDQAGLVLRHRSIDMTAYYAKAVVALLKQVAQTWPEVNGMIAAVETYLAVRRAAGFTLSSTEYLLRSFADFATARKQRHIRTATAIELGHPSEIGRATAHALSDHLSLCSVPSRGRFPARIAPGEPLRAIGRLS